MRKLLLLSAILGAACTTAQFNDAGRFHASIGGAFGVHATKYYQEQRFVILGTEFKFDTTTTDGAATLTVPIELDFGLAKFMSLGLYIEPGSYLDSSRAESNTVMMGGIQPKFYLLNTDRFALIAALQLGASGLRIIRSEDGYESDARYFGFQWGLGTGMAVGFGDHVGLRFMARYVSTSMPLRAWEENPDTVFGDYEAKLTTGGFVVQLSLCFRFGGD